MRGAKKREKVAEKTPPEIRQEVITRQSGVVSWSHPGMFFVPCCPGGLAGMGNLSPSGSTSRLCHLGEVGVQGHPQLPASGSGTTPQRDAAGVSSVLQSKTGSG